MLQNTQQATKSNTILAMSNFERGVPRSVNKLTVYWGNNLMRAEEMLWELDVNMNDSERLIAEADIDFLLDLIDTKVSTITDL